MIGQLQRVNREITPNTSMDTFLLSRLERLVRLRADGQKTFDVEALRRRAIYATYVDLRDRGLEEEARAILHRANTQVA